MIILDTNVISEAMKQTPDPVVMKWLNNQVPETLFLSSVTLAELLFGLSIIPEGRRKSTLIDALDILLIELFKHRILPFGAQAAHRYAQLAAKSRAAGKGFPIPDGYIAAIASFHGFVVATRDAAPFEAACISTVNPWTVE